MSKYFNLLLFLSFIFSEENTNYDPEDFADTALEFELSEVFEQPYQSRVRFTPNSSSKEWHAIQLFKQKNFTLGIRIDERKADNKFDISRLFISKNSSKYSIILGSIKTELAHGLVYSNEFGKFKSYSSFTPLSKNYNILKGSLNSIMPSSINGIAFLLNSKKFSHHFLIANGQRTISETDNDGVLDFSFSDSKLNNCERNIYSYQLERSYSSGKFGLLFVKEIFNNRQIQQNYYSVSFVKKFDKFSMSSEVAHLNDSVAYIINFGSKISEFQWHIQKRYLPYNWTNVVGLPFSEFKSGANENGLLLYLKVVKKPLLISAVIDVFSEVVGLDNLQNNSGFDRRMMMSYYNKFIKFELRFKEKEKFYNQYIQQFGLTKAYWELIDKKTYEAIIELPQAKGFEIKHKIVDYCPTIEEKEVGRLTTISFPKLFVKQWRITSCICWFDTDSWNSRLYAYEAGLNGEFPIRVFHGNGWQYFLKCEYGLSTQTDVSFRGSYEWKNKPLVSFAIQMDVTL